MRAIPLAVCVLLVVTSACSRLVDDFKVGDGHSRSNPCADNQVPLADGTCKVVGAAQCTDVLEANEDGGCTTRVPPRDCAEGFGHPGSWQCTTGDQQCDADRFPAATNQQGVTVYVDAEVTQPGNGERNSPYKTLAGAFNHPQALERPSEPLHLLVKGTFNEDVVLRRPDVTLQSCFGAATIVGQEASIFADETTGERHPCFPSGLESIGVARAAAVCLTPEANRVTLRGITITGPGDGVSVRGAEGVKLIGVRVHRTQYYGLRIFEAKTPNGIVAADVTLQSVAVYEARGAGVQVVGSNLRVNDSAIQKTLSLNDWNDDELRRSSPEASKVPERYRVGWARGISIHPGWWWKTKDANAEDFTRSTVTIEKSLITGHKEVAVFAAGAKVSIDQSFLGATPEGEASGRGLVAERSLPTGNETSVTVTRSVIERASDAAVDVRDAIVTLENTTIRDTRGRVGDGCSGQAIRARTFPTGDVRSTVTVTDSTLIGSRQAAVFAASIDLVLRRVLIRDVRPTGSEGACALAMGDGLALETFPGQPPTHAELEEVRIDGAARAAIASGGAALELRSTVLGCNVGELVDVTGQEQPRLFAGALCGCERTWSACRLIPETLDSWILSGPSHVWPDAQGAHRICVTSTYPSQVPLAGVFQADPIRPELAPRATDTTGCLSMPLANPDEVPGRLRWKPGFVSVASSGIAAEYRSVGQWPNSLIAESEWPSTSAIFILNAAPADAPFHSRPPAAEYLDRRKVPGDGQVFAPVWEPGWYTFELEGVDCDATHWLGGETQSNVRFARVDWGSYQVTDFSACRIASP